MNKLRKVQRSERGQALVLIILSIVALFGFAALAVDMGQIYSARRAAQSAADAAAMAAAFEGVGQGRDPSKAIAKAYELAKVNGYNNDQVTNWVVVNNPPIGGPYCGVCGDPLAKEYYQVKITVKMKPIFAQLVYNGAEQSTVEAIAHARDIATVSSGDALLSVSTDETSLEFDGTTSVNVNGGNIRSVGGMVKKGASGGIRVDYGKVYYGTSFSGHTSPFTAAQPTKNASVNIQSFTAPYCPTDAETKDITWADYGSYRSKKINGVDYFYYPSGLSLENLPNGIHCVQGGIGKGDFVGKRVLIVLLSGGIKQTGGDSLNLKAHLDVVDAKGNHFGGLLMYVPPTNTEELQIGGNSDAYVQGTIYAPGAACKIGGSSTGVAYHTAFICNDIKIHGTPDLKIVYRPEELFRLPPIVELVQ